jgi:hypothetical protein
MVRRVTLESLEIIVLFILVQLVLLISLSGWVIIGCPGWFFVSLAMSCQVIASGEALGADCAGVGSLQGMRPPVALQVLQTLEKATTKLNRAGV